MFEAMQVIIVEICSSQIRIDVKTDFLVFSTATKTSPNNEMSSAVVCIASLVEASMSTLARERCIMGEKTNPSCTSAHDGNRSDVVAT